MERDKRNPQYLLALEVTNLRLAVELASSAMRLGRWQEAYQHLQQVEAPGRRRQDHDTRQRGGVTGSVGPAAGDWRVTRPSLLVRIVLERVSRGSAA